MPETNQPEANQPESNQPESNQPESNQPESNQPETNQPETSQPPKNKQSILAFTWYHEHDYHRLIEVSRDREGLKDSYKQWLVEARRAFLKYKNMGFEPTRVYLDVQEYVSWCECRERPVNEKSREMFKEIKRQEFYRHLDRDE